MEMTMAVLTALGVFVGIPAVIGLTTVGWFWLKETEVRKTRFAEAAEKVAEFEKAA